MKVMQFINKRFVSDVVKVLVTSVSNKNDKVLSGYTPHFKLVNFEYRRFIGKMLMLRLKSVYLASMCHSL